MRSTRFLPILLGALAIEIGSILAGCICPTDPSHHPVKIDTIAVEPFDNSAASPVRPASGSVTARALMLMVQLKWKAAHFSSFLRTIAPATALAGSECPPVPAIYDHLDTIASAQVIRMEENGRERDVAEHFIVGRFLADNESTLGSLRRFDALVEMLNGVDDEASFYYPLTFDTALLLRDGFDAMKGSNVRFIVRLGLTDGRSIADTTDPITIL